MPSTTAVKHNIRKENGMNDPDLSGIVPLHVPEARRRIAALDEYLALDAASEEDIRRLAERIGVSRSSFFRLAAVWRNHRDARLLVIGKRGASKRHYGLSDRAKEIMAIVIAELGADVSVRKISDEIARRCTAEDVAPPSPQTVNNYARKARAASASAEGPPRIVVGRLWFHLPMSDRPHGAMPTVLVAVALPERSILSHRVATDPASPPSVNDLIDEVAGMRVTGAAKRPILLDPDDRRIAADALDRAGLGGTRFSKRSVQRELSKALNGRLGTLSAIHQRGFARPTTKTLLSRQDEALPAHDVAEIIETAVDAHNAATVAPRPEFDIAPQ